MAPARRVLLVVVADGPVVPAAAGAALHDLAGGGRTVRLGRWAPARSPARPPAYAEAVERARAYLDVVLPEAELILIVAGSPDDVPRAVAAAGPGPALLALLAVDHEDTRGLPPWESAVIDRRLREVRAALPEAVDFDPSPSSVQIRQRPDAAGRYDAALFTTRWPPAEDWVNAADLICAFTDAIQVASMRRFHAPAVPGALAAALTTVLDCDAGPGWGLHYYTGSVVAGLIDELERHARRHGNPVVPGPSEHSLACSALARWELDRQPYLIVVTSGMADEFRGTLANLRTAGARGLIVCADSRPHEWAPFQGTIHSAEDSREVMRARGLTVLDPPAPAAIGEALAAYADAAGPVVLFASREILDAPAGPTPAAVPPARPPARVREPATGPLIRMLGHGPVRVLCQPGPLTPAGSELTYRLARSAGVALADSLAHPGTVARYHHGRRVPEFLGTLSLYGWSARVHEFLHQDDRPRPAADQAVLFLNSRIAGLDTPFSPARLRRMRPIQVCATEQDRAPYAALAVTGDAEAVLRHVLDRLDVDPAVLDRRRAAIDATTDSFGDVTGSIPSKPMTPNYFFRQLHDVLDDLITGHGYTYTGVFDVGRCGLSAVCNLPRTGAGFSGWAGRALMGDALQALPGVLQARPGNVLAFTGDGAAALVPDIVPTLIRQHAVDGTPRSGNVSIFRLINGGHSVIRTYREGLSPGAVSGQTGVLTLGQGEWSRTFAGLTVTHRPLLEVDPAQLAKDLAEPSSMHLYSVVLGHTNEGDGLSRLAASGWQRDTLTTRTANLMTFGERP